MTKPERLTRNGSAELSPFGFRASFVIRRTSFDISNQFLHRLTPGLDEVLRPAGQVREGGFVHVNSQIVIERREDFSEDHRPFDRLPAPAVGRADNLSRLHASTGEQRT